MSDHLSDLRNESVLSDESRDSVEDMSFGRSGSNQNSGVVNSYLAQSSNELVDIAGTCSDFKRSDETQGKQMKILLVMNQKNTFSSISFTHKTFFSTAGGMGHNLSNTKHCIVVFADAFKTVFSHTTERPQNTVAYSSNI